MIFFAEKTDVIFTYSVNWKVSEVKWASRWDTYLRMSDVQIHWFSIINSVVVVFFLSGMDVLIHLQQGSLRLEKYLNIQGCLEK